MSDPPRRKGERLGLRGRLALSIAAIVLAGFAVTYVAVRQGTGQALRDRIDSELRTQSEAFAARLAAVGDSPRRVTLAAGGYVASQPFGPAARLLIATIRGGPTLSNEPELTGPAREREHETAAQRAGELGQTRALRTTPPGFSDVDLVDAGNVRVLTERVGTPRRPLATLRVGEPTQSVADAENEVGRVFLIAGGLAAALALAAGALLASRTAAPMRRMANTAATIDGGELSERIGPIAGSREMRTLGQSFDHMLDRLEGAFAKQREFVSDASHELRTPLTAIRGQIEVLARNPDPEPAEIRRVEGLVVAEVGRMQRLSDDLLVLARLDEQQPLQRCPIDVAALIRDLLSDPAIGAVQDGPLAAGILTGDPDRLAQLIRNLLLNARQHAGPGGRVSLGTSSRDDSLLVAVSDDGPGIAADERERVFERFHRAGQRHRAESGGSGLGLAIARAIAEAHGGRIWAEEAPGGGARICFELPGFEPAEPGT